MPDGSNGNQPVEQGQGKDGLTDTGADKGTSGGGSADTGGGADKGGDAEKGELAETGAGQTGFLLIGAATMIAGGVGFRMLPRLVGGRTAAAA